MNRLGLAILFGVGSGLLLPGCPFFFGDHSRRTDRLCDSSCQSDFRWTYCDAPPRDTEEVICSAACDGNPDDVVLVGELDGLTMATGWGGELYPIALDELQEIKGELVVYNGVGTLSIPNLQRVGGTICVEDSVLDGFELPSLTTVGGRVLAFNSSIMSVSGFRNLSATGEGVGFHGIEGLSTLAGFEGLVSIDSEAYVSLAISRTAALEELAVFSGLTTLRGLAFSENALLSNLSGLESVEVLEEGLDIWGNPSLMSLVGLSGLRTVGGWIRIIDNPRLPTCKALALVDQVGGEKPGLAVQIEGNDDAATCP